MKDGKIKVLLVGPYPPPEGGVSIHLQRLLEKSVNHPKLELAVFDAGRRMLIYQNRKRSGLISAMFFFISASIVHVHVSHPYKVFIGRIAKLFRKKLFFTQHNPRLATHPSTLRMMELSDQTVFVYRDNEHPGRLVIPAYIPASGNKLRDYQQFPRVAILTPRFNAGAKWLPWYFTHSGLKSGKTKLP